MGTCPICGSEGELGAACPAHPEWRLVDPLQLEEHSENEDVLLGHLVSDRFALVRVLGKGGMGWVYEAVQVPIGRHVAVKILRSDYVEDELVRKRFFREARVLGMLQHVNLVTLYDYGVVEIAGEELLFIAMELLRGRTLTSVMRHPRALGAARLLTAMRGIASGLAEAHRNGIVHRDLKPDNILMVQDSMHREQAKVVDFGIARLSTTNTVLTRTGMVFGTPAYMSPEQAAGEANVGPGADVYAFGVLLYRLLAGQLPFTGDTPLQVLMQHMNVPPPALELRPGIEVPGALIELTYHCMQKRPEERPVDAGELEQRLADIAVELQDGVDLVAGPTLEDASPPEGVLGENDDTWVVGGDVEVLTNPDGPNAIAKADAHEPTEPDVPVQAYRVEPENSSPSALREVDTPPYRLVGIVVAVVVLLGVGLFLALGTGDSGDDEGAEAASEASDSDEGKPSERKARKKPRKKAGEGEGTSASGIDESTGEPEDGTADLDELLAELERLRLARDTAMTIVDPMERKQRQAEVAEKIRVVEEALAEMGVEVPEE